MVCTVQILFRSQFNAFFFFFFLFVLTAACLYNSLLHLFTVRVFWQSCCLQTRWMALSSVSGYMMSGLFLAVCKMSNSASFCLCCHTPGQRGDGGDAGWLMSSPLLPLSCIQVCRCFHLCVRWNKYKLNYMNIPNLFQGHFHRDWSYLCGCVVLHIHTNKFKNKEAVTEVMSQKVTRRSWLIEYRTCKNVSLWS